MSQLHNFSRCKKIWCANTVRGLLTSSACYPRQINVPESKAPFPQRRVSNDPLVGQWTNYLEDLRLRQYGEDADRVHKTSFGHVRFDDDNWPTETRRADTTNNLTETADTANNLTESTDTGNSLTERVDTANNLTESTDTGNSLTERVDMANNLTERVDTAKNLTDSDRQCSDGYIDEVYFGNALSKNVFSYDVDSVVKNSKQKEEFDQEEHGFIDEAFFKDASPDHSSPVQSYSKNDINNDSNLNYVDECFFKEAHTSTSELSISKETYDQMTEFEQSLLLWDSEPKSVPNPRYALGSHTQQIEEEMRQSYQQRLQQMSQSKKKVKSTVPGKDPLKITEENTIAVSDPNAQVTSTVEEDTALAYALKLRKEEKAKEFSKGEVEDTKELPRYKRIIAALPNHKDLNKNEIKCLLKNAVIYNEGDLVAVNKPYGMRIHGGGDAVHSVLTLTELLPQLASIVGAEKLHMVHRLDVNTTGVMLLAKSDLMASELREMFKKNTVIKTYLAITKTIPHIKQGLIDIPLLECSVGGKKRMALRPVLEDRQGSRVRLGARAVTKFKVLSERHSCALLSVNPLTGVRHQIRAHLGLGLKCPVLGDHKYSYTNKLVPQKVSSDALNRLQMKQSRVRDLPIMLHSSSIFLPEILDSRNLKISCVPPLHFRLGLKALRLTSSKSDLQMRTIETVDFAAQPLGGKRL